MKFISVIIWVQKMNLKPSRFKFGRDVVLERNLLIMCLLC